MRRRRILSRAAGVCVLAAILVGGLITAATATGQIAYVATHGVSMEPQFHRGDLAVVRPAASYEVGDVVAYRSELLDTVVLHRIVARDGDRYTFKATTTAGSTRTSPPRRTSSAPCWCRSPRADGSSAGPVTGSPSSSPPS